MTIVPLLSACFALLYAWSSLVKMFTFERFVLAVRAFEVIPGRHHRLLRLTAVLVIGSELLFAICFSLGVLLQAVFAAAAVQLAIFTALFLRLALRRQSVACNCFSGSGKATNLPIAIGRNLGLLCLAAIGSWLGTNAAGMTESRFLLLAAILAIAFVYHSTMYVRRLKRLRSAIWDMLADQEAAGSPSTGRRRLLLFLHYADDRNVDHVEWMLRTYSPQQVQLFYNGPEWKLKGLLKRLSQEVRAVADETGGLHEKLRIDAYPSAIKLNG